MNWIKDGVMPRRKQAKPPVIKRKGPTWEVTGADKKAQKQWEREPLEDGSTRHVELIPPPRRTDGFQTDHDRSIFIVEIQEPCMVGGQHCAPGDIVECFKSTAMCLICRGKILSEQKNAI